MDLRWYLTTNIPNFPNFPNIMLINVLSYLALLEMANPTILTSIAPDLRTAFISETYSPHGDVIWSSELIIQVIYFRRWTA